MRLFSNGCSFLTERPKDNVPTFVTKELAREYKVFNFFENSSRTTL